MTPTALDRVIGSTDWLDCASDARKELDKLRADSAWRAKVELLLRRIYGEEVDYEDQMAAVRELEAIGRKL